MPSPTSFVFPIGPDINAIQLLQSIPGPQNLSSKAQIPVPKNVIGFNFVYNPQERPMLPANVASGTHTRSQIPTRQGTIQQRSKDQAQGLKYKAHVNPRVLKNNSPQKSTICAPFLGGTRNKHSSASLSHANADLTALPGQSSTRRTSSRSITIRSESPSLPITPPPSSPPFINPERPNRPRSARCTECRSKEARCEDFEFCRLIICDLCGPKHCVKPEACPKDFECEHMICQGNTLKAPPRSSIQRGKGPKKVVKWADKAVKRWLEEDEMKADPLPAAKKKKLEVQELESESEYDGVSATESEEL